MTEQQPPVTAGESGQVWDALVVGAGISGLVCAYRMRQAGLRVLVIDAAQRPGGVIGSVRHEGWLVECGPNSALDTSPLIGELVQALGLGPQWLPAAASAARRYVLRDGVPLALPMSPRAFVASRLFSARAKLRLLREPFVGRAAPDAEESIAAFVRRRLGSEFLDYAIDPFVAGVYAGDPEQISVSAAFPRLHALEQRWGSLIRGQVLGARQRRRDQERARNTAGSFSFIGGMQTLTDALAAAVGPLQLSARVTRLQRDREGVFTVESLRDGAATRWRARAVVLATPADTAATLLREHAADAAAALDAIDYAPVASVASGYAAEDIVHSLDGFGCLVPRKEQRRVLGVLFSSSMFEGRAEPGAHLLTTFVGGRRQPQWVDRSEADIASLVHAEHQALLGARRAPLFQRVTRWPRAIPQYTLGHRERVARTEAAQRVLPGLWLCGSWKGGVSVGDCIKSGHLQADLVAGWLRGQR